MQTYTTQIRKNGFHVSTRLPRPKPWMHHSARAHLKPLRATTPCMHATAQKPRKSNKKNKRDIDRQPIVSIRLKDSLRGNWGQQKSVWGHLRSAFGNNCNHSMKITLSLNLCPTDIQEIRDRANEASSIFWKLRFAKRPRDVPNRFPYR